MARAKSINVTFRLNKGKTVEPKKKYSIYVRIRYGRQVDYNASIGEKVFPNDWNADKEVIKNKAHINDRDLVNEKIDNIRKHIISEGKELTKTGKQLSYIKAKHIFESFFEDSNEGLTFFKFFNGYIEESKSRINLRTNTVIRDGTVSSYKVTKNIFQRFDQEVYHIDFDNINLDFYYDFIDFGNRNDHSWNYIGKNIKILKTILNVAFDRGVQVSLDYQKRQFKVLTEDSYSIYLTKGELKAFEKINLSENEGMSRARDLFLIGAYTGLRISDYNSLSVSDIREIDGEKYIDVKAQKTKDRVVIPLHTCVKRVLEKYNGKPPKGLPEQTINKHIKKIGEKLEIDTPETFEITKGGKKVRKTFKRFQLIQSHTARRSFCTNTYLTGMPIIDIMTISGHTTEVNFLKYIKVSKEERAKNIGKHDFFRGIDDA